MTLGVAVQGLNDYRFVLQTITTGIHPGGDYEGLRWFAFTFHGPFEKPFPGDDEVCLDWELVYPPRPK